MPTPAAARSVNGKRVISYGDFNYNWYTDSRAAPSLQLKRGDEQIEVQMGKGTTQGYRDSERRPGVKLWTIELAAGEKREVVLDYKCLLALHVQIVAVADIGGFACAGVAEYSDSEAL